MVPVRKEWGFDGAVLDIGVGGDRKRGTVGVDLRRTELVDVQADGTALPFATDTFDAVVCYHVVEHLAPAQIRRLSAEMARVCRPDGRAHVLVDRDVSRPALLGKDQTHRERYAVDRVRSFFAEDFAIDAMQTHNLLGNVYKHPLTWPWYLSKATKVYLEGRPQGST